MLSRSLDRGRLDLTPSRPSLEPAFSGLGFRAATTAKSAEVVLRGFRVWNWGEILLWCLG